MMLTSCSSWNRLLLLAGSSIGVIHLDPSLYVWLWLWCPCVCELGGMGEALLSSGYAAKLKKSYNNLKHNYIILIQNRREEPF